MVSTLISNIRNTDFTLNHALAGRPDTTVAEKAVPAQLIGRTYQSETVPANSAVGADLKVDVAHAQMMALLTSLAALLKSLKTLMERHSSELPQPSTVTLLPAPQADAVAVSETKEQPKHTVWRDKLEAYINDNVRNTHGLFDRRLSSMFDSDYEPVGDFLSGKAKGQKPDDIRAGVSVAYDPVYTGSNENTDHLAAIKVAMMKFGQSPASIFTEVTRAEDGYNIVMRDGFKLHISNEELELAFKDAGFAGHDEEMIKDASFLRGVMTKRRYIEHKPEWNPYDVDGYHYAYWTYPGFLAHSYSGLEGDVALKALGLGKHIEVVEAQSLGSQVGLSSERRPWQQNDFIIDGVMTGLRTNFKVSPSLKVFVLRD